MIFLVPFYWRSFFIGIDILQLYFALCQFLLTLYWRIQRKLNSFFFELLLVLLLQLYHFKYI